MYMNIYLNFLLILSSIVVQSLMSCPTFCDLMDSARQAPLTSTVSWSVLQFMYIKLVMLSNHYYYFSLRFISLIDENTLFQFVVL